MTRTFMIKGERLTRTQIKLIKDVEKHGKIPEGVDFRTRKSLEERIFILDGSLTQKARDWMEFFRRKQREKQCDTCNETFTQMPIIVGEMIFCGKECENTWNEGE